MAYRKGYLIYVLFQIISVALLKKAIQYDSFWSSIKCYNFRNFSSILINDPSLFLSRWFASIYWHFELANSFLENHLRALYLYTHEIESNWLSAKVSHREIFNFPWSSTICPKLQENEELLLKSWLIRQIY